MSWTGSAPLKVSVIVPVYNAEKYLPECLDSLLGQTLRDVEIIAVDDASNDKSLAVLNTYANQHPGRLVVVKSSTNGGPGAARNLGIDVARGEYLAFVDPDDWLASDMLEACYSKAARTGADIVDCDYAEYFGDAVPLRTRRIVTDHLMGPADARLRDERIVLPLQNLTAKLIRRSLLVDRGVRIPEYYVGEDQVMAYLRCAADVCGKVNEPLYYYRRTGESSTQSRNSDRLLQVKEAVEAVINLFHRSGLYDEHKDAVDFLYIWKCYRQLLVYRLFYFDRPDARALCSLRSEMRAVNPAWRSNRYYRRLSVSDRVLLKLNDLCPALLAGVASVVQHHFRWILPRHIPRNRCETAPRERHDRPCAK